MSKFQRLTQEFLSDAWDKPIGDSPFLMEQKIHWQKSKPLQGLRILQCLPITYATLRKTSVLLSGGAEVSLMPYQGFHSIEEEECIEMASRNGVQVFNTPEKVIGSYEYFLDCNAQLLDLVSSSPSCGYIEITKSGIEKYRKKASNLPIVSIDDSLVKCLETYYGTGEATVRALQDRFCISLDRAKVVLFGYGKVGSGVCKHLKKAGAEITIIEKDQGARQRAQEKGYATMLFNKEEALQVISLADGIITATGKKEIMSKMFSKEDRVFFHENKWLANVGADNEFGTHFADHAGLLFGGAPVNFATENPTKMQYLDPIMFLHNEAIIWIKEKRISSGLHPVPVEIDLHVLNKWKTLWQEDISDLFAF